ncbi:MAG TPA: hypothetical protein VFQ41_10265 [Candidatus Angelobacter sp.]|nr:hypothetical protein [Candidatus Angelobacter sp.]
MQPVAQGCVLLQLPLQAAKPLASARNWRAETVPALRTLTTSAANNIDLIFFIMVLLLVPGPKIPGPDDN